MSAAGFSEHPRAARLRLLGLLAIVSLAYLNSFQGGFHYDDSHSIVQNPSIRSLASIPSYFVDSGTFSAEPRMAMYRPLVQVTYAVNYAVGGLDAQGYHLVNLAAHLLVVALVCLTVGRLTRHAGLGWWAALLYGLHPVHTQVVNYLSSRSESLAAAAVLGALYLSSVARPPSRWGLAAYAGGLLAKSAAAAFLPLAALLRAVTPWRRPLAALWPYGAVTGAYVAFIWAEGFLPRSLGQDVRPWAHHVLTQTKALTYYLHLIAAPVKLSVEPAFQVSRSLLEPAVAASGLLALSLCWISLRGLRRGVVAGLGALWFLAALAVPFVVPLNVLVNEHRLYLPAAGVALALASLTRSSRRRSLVPGAALAAAVLALLTWQRNAVWATDLRLWEDAVTKAPQAFRAHGNLGLARYEAGDLDGARQALERALELNPGYAKTWSNLGLVLEAAGEVTGASAAYGQALERRPDLVGARLNLVSLHLARGEIDRAAEHLATAARLRPQDPDVYVHVGRLRQQVGDTRGAAAAYERALQLDAESATAWNNLGLMREAAGDTSGARQALERAVGADVSLVEAQLNLRLLEARRAGREPRDAYEALLAEYPEQASLWQALGEELLRQGDGIGALDALERAARLDPARAEAMGLLGGARRLAGDLGGAIEAYTAALRLAPSAQLYANLASAYAEAGLVDSARAALAAARALEPTNDRARAGLERLTGGGRP